MSVLYEKCQIMKIMLKYINKTLVQTSFNAHVIIYNLYQAYGDSDEGVEMFMNKQTLIIQYRIYPQGGRHETFFLFKIRLRSQRIHSVNYITCISHEANVSIVTSLRKKKLHQQSHGTVILPPLNIQPSDSSLIVELFCYPSQSHTH